MGSPLPAATRHVCATHADRPAHAVCMTCRKAVCGECATEWDGINYCVSCLPGRRRGARGGPAYFGGVAMVAATVLLLVAAARLLVWLGVLVAGL